MRQYPAPIEVFEHRKAVKILAAYTAERDRFRARFGQVEAAERLYADAIAAWTARVLELEARAGGTR